MLSDPLTNLFRTPLTLEAADVLLEPLTHAHAENLSAIGRDEEIWRWLPASVPTTLAEMQDWIAGAQEEEWVIEKFEHPAANT